MHRIALAVVTILGLFLTSPTWAQGEIVITQAKALAGNVTPGDAAGYPVTLTQPGAYLFGSNLNVPSGSYGLQVNAHNVDIDMNGFGLFGGNVANFGLVTYYGEGRIHGGVISNFRSVGLYIRNSGWTIEDMKIVRNGGSGIDATGARFTSVKDSLIVSNSGDGIITSHAAFISNNTLGKNGRVGIICGDSCQAINNIINENQYGIQIGEGLVLANTITRNTWEGIVGTNGFAGFGNNTLIGNSAAGPRQVSYANELHPNMCIGKPC